LAKFALKMENLGIRLHDAICCVFGRVEDTEILTKMEDFWKKVEMSESFGKLHRFCGIFVLPNAQKYVRIS
jgi:hypothetical protein